MRCRAGADAQVLSAVARAPADTAIRSGHANRVRIAVGSRFGLAGLEVALAEHRVVRSSKGLELHRIAAHRASAYDARIAGGEAMRGHKIARREFRGGQAGGRLLYAERHARFIAGHHEAARKGDGECFGVGAFHDAIAIDRVFDKIAR